jgi:hypothetical protein
MTAKYAVGETVTYRDLNGAERTGEVWSFGSANAQRWVTTEDREFALLTFAKGRDRWYMSGGQWFKEGVKGLREVAQNWRAELARATAYLPLAA